MTPYRCPECDRPEGDYHHADCSKYAARVVRPVIYLSGHRHEAIVRLRDVGYLLTPRMGQSPVAGVPWAADNGCFSNPEGFDLNVYMGWLRDLAPYADSCLFATAPDVVGDAPATLARSLPVLPMIRKAGYPAALVAQDGLEEMEVPWHAFDVLFIGGSTRWKLAAEALTRMAREMGKWVHMGRVNSYRRLRHAEAMGCHSVDGTFLKFGPSKNLIRLNRWMAEMAMNPRLMAWRSERQCQTLTPEQVAEIRTNSRSHRSLGLEYGVSKTTIGRIKRGTMWQPKGSALREFPS